MEEVNYYFLFTGGLVLLISLIFRFPWLGGFFGAPTGILVENPKSYLKTASVYLFGIGVVLVVFGFVL